MIPCDLVNAWEILTICVYSFGWVNASYVYGLQIVNAHMRRALGTLTPYDTFVKALDDSRAKILSEMD